MEHEELDDLFRKALASEEPNEGTEVKKKIWNKLDINQTPPKSGRNWLPLIIFFLMAGAIAYLLRDAGQVRLQKERLESEMSDLQSEQKSLENELSKMQIRLEQVSKRINQESGLNKSEIEIPEPLPTQVIEKEIRFFDTVYVEKEIPIAGLPQVIYRTDTVFVENNSTLAESEPEKANQPENPGSIEFVFDKEAVKNFKKKKNKELFIMESGKSQLSDQKRKDLNVINF